MHCGGFSFKVSWAAMNVSNLAAAHTASKLKQAELLQPQLACT